MPWGQKVHSTGLARIGSQELQEGAVPADTLDDSISGGELGPGANQQTMMYPVAINAIDLHLFIRPQHAMAKVPTADAMAGVPDSKSGQRSVA